MMSATEQVLALSEQSFTQIFLFFLLYLILWCLTSHRLSVLDESLIEILGLISSNSGRWQTGIFVPIVPLEAASDRELQKAMTDLGEKGKARDEDVLHIGVFATFVLQFEEGWQDVVVEDFIVGCRKGGQVGLIHDVFEHMDRDVDGFCSYFWILVFKKL